MTNPLIITLLRRAAIPTPAVDAEQEARDYVTRRSVDDKELGSLDKLTYVRVLPHAKGFTVIGTHSSARPCVVRTMVEARAHILARWW